MLAASLTTSLARLSISSASLSRSTVALRPITLSQRRLSAISSRTYTSDAASSIRLGNLKPGQPKKGVSINKHTSERDTALINVLICLDTNRKRSWVGDRPLVEVAPQPEVTKVRNRDLATGNPNQASREDRHRSRDCIRKEDSPMRKLADPKALLRDWFLTLCCFLQSCTEIRTHQLGQDSALD